MKRWCIWCESENRTPKGWFWIHTNCAHKLMNIHNDIEAVKKILQGIHPRNKKESDRLKCVCKFVEDMEEHRKRWDNITSLLSDSEKIRP